jgi:AcrR family transcriptional regulator
MSTLMLYIKFERARLCDVTTRLSDLQARRREHRRNARRRLLDAAHRLLESQPWAEISLDDITSAAEVARTAFYRHFEDRQHLLKAMLDDVGLELGHVADDWMAETDDPAAELRQSLADLTAIFVEHGRLIQAISDTATYDPEISELYSALADGFVTATARRIEADIASGRSQIPEHREVARSLTWMNERYLLASFGRRPFADSVAVTEALATVWISPLYGRPASET